jgi:hypothetical protein
MTIAAAPASVSLSQVNVELSRASGAYITMNDAAARTLAGVSTTSGVSYSMDNFRGKSAYTPMTIAKSDVNDTDIATGTAYTGRWYPSVVVQSGGSGGFTYAWTFVSNPGGFTMPTANLAQAQVSHTVSKFGYSGTATLNCAVTDNTGHTVNVTVYVTVNIMDPAG